MEVAVARPKCCWILCICIFSGRTLFLHDQQFDVIPFFDCFIEIVVICLEINAATKSHSILLLSFQLKQLGVPEGSIKHGLTTMESDKWIICVEPNQVTMIDLQNGAQVTRRSMQAEACIMNPGQNILAVRSGTTLQMFNLDAKAKVKGHSMPEPVVFWKWTSSSNLALVTGTAV